MLIQRHPRRRRISVLIQMALDRLRPGGNSFLRNRPMMLTHIMRSIRQPALKRALGWTVHDRPGIGPITRPTRYMRRAYPLESHDDFWTRFLCGLHRTVG